MGATRSVSLCLQVQTHNNLPQTHTTRVHTGKLVAACMHACEFPLPQNTAQPKTIFLIASFA